MEAKYTPGPWEDVGANKDGERCIYGADDSAVAVTIPVGNPDSKLQRSEANARLIAAAPMLLELAEAIFSAADNGNIANTSDEDSVGVLLDAARAAIAAATTHPEPTP